MKHPKVLFLSVVLLLVVSGLSRAQVHWRSAKTMPKGSYLVMASWYYTDFTKFYDWNVEEWKDLPSDSSRTYWGFNTMFGYAITDRLEAHVHVPITFKSAENDTIKRSSSGLGDIYLKSRYSVLPWAKDRHGLTLTGALRFPTGDEEASPALGDGTTDFAIGEIFTTAWMNNFRGHIKAGYWFNGKNDDEVNIGDEFKLILKLDRKLSPKVMPFMTYIYYSQTKKETDAGIVANSQKIRHYFVLGGVYKPIEGMFIRPKVVMPIGGEGGSLYAFKPLIDFWYIFKI